MSYILYNQKFSREANFRYFREQFENAKKCTLKESLEVSNDIPGVINCLSTWSITNNNVQDD